MSLELLYVEINLIGLILIFIMYLKGKYNEGVSQKAQRLFNHMLITTAMLLFLDTMMWWVDGRSFCGSRIVNNIVSSLFLGMTAIVAFFSVPYIIFKISGYRGWNKKKMRLCMVPGGINGLCALLSMKTGWLFYIDEMNKYHRGPLFIVHVLAIVFYFVYGVTFILRKAKKQTGIKRRESYMLLSLFMLPVIGYLMQAIFYGLSIAIICCIISLLIVFINVQNDLITTDALTKVNNRWGFESFMEEHSVNFQGDEVTFMLMIDADDFKEINDIYGHGAGDNALMQIASLLKASCLNRDFIARFGGDEFTVVGQRKTKTDVENLIASINKALVSFNGQKKLPYELGISIGYSIYQPDDEQPLERLMHEADQSMYAEKRKKKIERVDEI